MFNDIWIARKNALGLARNVMVATIVIAVGTRYAVMTAEDLDSSHTVVTELSCPLLSGPLTMRVWIKEGTTNACQEAQARGDHREVA